MFLFDAPFMPSSLFNDTMVSSERKSQCPPKVVAALQILLSQIRSVEKVVWDSPAGQLIQGTEPSIYKAPEVNLKRLIPQIDYVEAWKLLHNVYH